MRDLRLYVYGQYGNLQKLGDLKTDSNGIARKHFFNSLEEIRKRINELRDKPALKNEQFIIIEYFKSSEENRDPYINSLIIEIDNPKIEL